MSDIQFTNIWNNAAVSQRCVIVHGQSGSVGLGEGYVIVWFNSSNFPSQRFPISNGFFRAFIPLEEGFNQLTFETDFPGQPKQTKSLNLRYLPVKSNPPVHFCLLVARDSPHQFDALPDRVKQEGGNNLGTAIKKMRMAAYMTSAFTMEQMNRNQCGFRSYSPYSQVERDTLSCRDSSLRETAHIHVVMLDQTVAQIRDPDLAQQNSKGKNTGGLFGIAYDALKKYGEPFSSDDFVQAACIFLDAHWDPQMNLILGHAALGGGISNIKLAIFGSHALWSWPTCIESLPTACLDETRTDTRYVANDANQSGTAWEAMCIGMGAFQHEIGHLLGCPHEPDGIMLRGYLFWNRSFCALEGYSSRENRCCVRSPLPKDEDHWHRMDIMRFLYHPSFALPGERERYSTVSKPIVYTTHSGLNIQCPQGIYMIDVLVDGNSKGHIEYNLVCQLDISLPDIERAIAPEYRKKPIDLQIHGAPMEQVNVKNVQKMIALAHSIGKQYSVTNGLEKGQVQECTLSANDSPSLVRIYSGLALDGIEFIYQNNYSIMFGKRGGSPHDFLIPPEDQFVGISVRSGAWVDAAGVITRNSRSPIWGGQGGGTVDLIPPPGYRISGIKGWFEAWCVGIAIRYEV